MGLKALGFSTSVTEYKIKNGAITKNGEPLTQKQIFKELNSLNYSYCDIARKYNELNELAGYLENKLKENKVTF